MNTFKTFILMFGMMMLLMFVGRLVGGINGMALFFGIGLIFNLLTYWFSDKIVLMMYGAKPLPREDNPDLYMMVEELCAKANLPLPRLFIMAQDTPNAFATGRNPAHAVVCVTTGILQLLTKDELKGVLAHELSHVKNRDILIATVAAVIASLISMISSAARWGMLLGGGRSRDNDDDGGGFALIFAAILAPIIALIIQLAISRAREYEADRTGGIMAGRPESLANALGKLEGFSKRIPMLRTSTATAHMFIVNPLTGKSFLKLFSTHPPIEDRIKKLKALSAELEQKKYNLPNLIT